jgi:hypothetical protein
VRFFRAPLQWMIIQFLIPVYKPVIDKKCFIHPAYQPELLVNQKIQKKYFQQYFKNLKIAISFISQLHLLHTSGVATNNNKLKN